MQQSLEDIKNSMIQLKVDLEKSIASGDMSHLDIVIMKTEEVLEEMHLLRAQSHFKAGDFAQSLQHIKQCENSDVTDVRLAARILKDKLDSGFLAKKYCL